MTPLERAQAFRSRFAHLVAEGRAAEWSAMRQDISTAAEAHDVGYLVALSEHLRGDPELVFALHGESAFLRLPLLRTDAALRAFFAGADRAIVGSGAAGPFAQQTSRRRDGALLGYAFGDMAVVAAVQLGLEGEAAREVLACFLQERVIAGGDPARFDDVRAFWDRVKDDVPLGVLPLCLLSIERGALETPRHTDCATGGYAFRCNPYGPSARTAPTTRAVRADNVREATAEELDAFGIVMGHPALFPNATIEAHVITLSPELTDGHPSVVGLPLPCLESPEPNSFLEEAIDAREAFGRLLRVATEGGCYGKGQSAAYGRLYAWQCLAALVGLAWGTPLAQIEEEANRASFTWFRLRGPWYTNVSVDIGLACLRSDRQTLVVLAGTDCD